MLSAPAPFQGWLLAESDASLAGLGILFRRDTGLVAESPVLVRARTDQYFAHVAVGSGWQTDLAAANPSDARADCRASLYDASGILLSSAGFSLIPKGHILTTAQDMFNVTSALSGHIEISCSTPVVAVETFRSTFGLATVAAQGDAVLGATNRRTTFFPGVRGASPEWTGIAYANPSTDPALVELRLFESDGRQVAYSRAVLPPKAQSVTLARDLSSDWSGTGYLTLTSNSAIVCLQLNGAGDPGSTPFSGWSALTDLGTALYIPHVAQGEGWTSILSLINASPIENALTIRVFGPSGAVSATGVLRLAAGQQITRSLADLVPVGIQLSGSVEITSPEPFLGATAYQNDRGAVSVPLTLPLDAYSRSETGHLLVRQRVNAATGAVLLAGSAEDGDPLGKFRLVIPPGALAVDTDVSVYLNRADLPNADPSLRLVQFPFRFYPSGLAFRKPVSLTLPIPSGILGAYSASLDAVQVFTYVDDQALWLPVPIVARSTQDNTVTAELSHFSDYAPQVAIRRTARNVEDDVRKCFELGGYGAAEVEGFTKLLRTRAVPGVDIVGEIASTAASAMEISQYMNDGQFMLAAAEASAFIGETAGQWACKRGLGETPIGYVCEQAVSGVFYVAKRAGEKFGSFIGDVGVNSNIRNYQKQLNRYFYWLEQRNTPFEQMPRCSGGWLQDPTSDGCTLYDKDLWPPILKYDPLNGCIMEYPCGLGNPYTLDGLHREAQGLLARDRRLAREKAEALRAEVVRQMLELTRQAELAKYPSSSFTVSPTQIGMAPFRVSFDGSSSTAGASPIKSYTWDFGDGSRGAGVTATHTYEIAGSYAVHLYVTDSAGYTVSSTRFITVNRNPNPSKPAAQPTLTANPTSVSTPGSTTLSGSGFPAGDFVTVSWANTLGQNQSAAPIRVSDQGSFTYSLSFPSTAPTGDYTVVARSAPAGVQSSEVRLRVSSQLPPPRVDAIDPSTKTLGGVAAEQFRVAFSGSGFTSGTFVKVLYAADGLYAGVPRVKGEVTGVVPSEVIQSSTVALLVPVTLAPGEYDLVVTNPDGQTSAPKRLSVLAGTAAWRGPTAHFNMSGGGKSGADGQTLTYSVPVNGNVNMTFTSTSTQGSAAITSYVWKSNGTQICSNSSTCNYTFGTPSNTITLTVTDSNGLSSTATGQVNLTFQSGPTAHFNMSGGGKSGADGQTLTYSVPVNGNVNMTFTSTSTQGSAAITSYVWKSNGTQICSNSSTCNYTFGTPSNTITLTVTDSNGLSSTATGQVNLTFQSAAPQISWISPSTPPRAAGNQNVWVYGSGFQSGLTVTVGFPGGGSGTLSGTQIQNVSDGSFMMVINFNNNPGSYWIRVNNPGGATSNTFYFNVN